MLKELKSSIFYEKKPLKFSYGLNLINGDKYASNSIGKSTFLMILDFIFGGTDYLTHNQDVVKEMGHHVFEFSFLFNGENYYFKRGTENNKIFYFCNKNYEVIEEKTLKEYSKFLKIKYNLEDLPLTFRNTVSLYSRVWGRNNLNPSRPLSGFHGENKEETMNRLIKLFGKYSPLENAVKKNNEYKTDDQALKRVFRSNYLTKITLKKYKGNTLEIENLSKQLKEIENELRKNTINLENIKNEVLINKYEKKKSLTQRKNLLELKEKRIEKEKLKGSSISKLELEKIEEFFPDLNKKRMIEIEMFHTNLSKKLKNQIKNVDKLLKEEKEEIELEIKKIDYEIIELQEKIDISPEVLEKIKRIILTLNELQKENEFYDLGNDLKNKIETTEIEKLKERIQLLDIISGDLNFKMKDIVEEIAIGDKCPNFVFTEKDYRFQIIGNTGTGKAYENLLVYDLAILELTKLPFLIHDSLLFKNIGIFGMEKILLKYTTFTDKQIFISIDEFGRYDQETEGLINKSKVIGVSKEKPLFGKNWS